ncbi:hypothetical protein F7725_005215 [Dissostichus mawsoni]|uniref:Uncharacterized protein n=1 Tax=Dissostichus mawsoni TaxID=36200 RepID=A0A7J5YR22_DISMA|nr:hypothetical protein F7725_005215 [Dissostichus mawsoni]
MGGAEQGLNGRCRLQRLESGNETENENEDNEKTRTTRRERGKMETPAPRCLSKFQPGRGTS